MLESSDGGSTWGHSVLLTTNATYSCRPVIAGELADGTILVVLSADTSTNTNNGFAKQYVATLVGGPSGTWTNLSLTPSNPIAVPWTYGTNEGLCFGSLLVDSSGNPYIGCYGTTSGTTNWACWLLTCPVGSVYTNGSLWTTQGTIVAASSGSRWGEAALCNVGGSNLVAVIRNDTVTPYDLYHSTSANWGATWTAPAEVGLPNAIASAFGGPSLFTLSSGNVVLGTRIGYGTTYDTTGIALSTDNGATFIDRPVYVTESDARTGIDGGYPSFSQIANGNIVCLYYRAPAGQTTSTDIWCLIFTPDFISNWANLYDGCESLTSWIQANAALSSTHVHNGSDSILVDNTVGGIYAQRTIWSPNLPQQSGNIQYSYWTYCTLNTSSLFSSRVNDNATWVTTGNRCNAASYQGDVEFYNGSAYVNTGVATALNVWQRWTVSADIGPSAVTGFIALNNVVATSALAAYGPGTAPQSVQFCGGSTGGSAPVTYYLDDLQVTQYTASTRPFPRSWVLRSGLHRL